MIILCSGEFGFATLLVIIRLEVNAFVQIFLIYVYDDAYKLL